MQSAPNKNDHAQPPTFDHSPEDRMQFVRLNIRDWLQGTRNLEPSQAGVYIQIVLLFSDNLGVLPDDDGFVAGHLKMGIRYYRKIKAQLIALGKIEIRNGYIWNRRAAIEVASFCSTSKAKRKAAREREEKKRNERASGARQVLNGYPIGTSQVPDACATGNENSEIASNNNDGATTALPLQSVEKETEKEVPPNPLKGARASKPEKLLVAKQCFDEWRDLAKRTGLPVPRPDSFDGDYARDILNRIGDHVSGGASDNDRIALWRDLLCKIERSPFLRGQVTDFKASLPWLCKKANFRKVMGDTYGNGVHAERANGASSGIAKINAMMGGSNWQ